MEFSELKSRLVSKIEQYQLLGFDYASQALHAILTHDDYATRWDIADDERFIDLADQYRFRVYRMIKQNVKRNGSML